MRLFDTIKPGYSIGGDAQNCFLRLGLSRPVDSVGPRFAKKQGEFR
jgi:hypothetical protein